MSLEDLNRSMYEKGADELGQRPQAPGEFDPLENKNNQTSPFQGEQHWGKADKSMLPKQKKVLLGIAGGIIALFVFIGIYEGYQWYERNAFHQDRVSISFEGPNTADSTQAVHYLIHYKNDNGVTLKNATIALAYSENFQPADNVNLKYLSTTSSTFFVGDIKSHAEGTATLNGTFYAPKDFPVYLHATLQYIPSNGSQQLETTNQFAVDITNAPVQLDVTLPETVADGDSVEYVIDYKNLDTQPLKNAQVRLDYPDGFTFSDSSPVPSEGQIAWYLGSLDSNQGGEIRIHGTMHGLADQTKALTVSLGHKGSDGQFALYNQRAESSKMIASLLTISQSLADSTGGVVRAGDTLKYVITYRNTSNLGLRNAIVTETLKSDVLDLSKLKTDSGALDSTKSVITWKASDIPQLANIPPQGSGTIQFSIPVKSIIPVVDTSSKNFTVNSVATIDSPDIPTLIGSNKIVSSNTLSLKLGSKVILDVTGYFYDTLLVNSGPLPMSIGKETTFTLHWGITNISNDLSSAVVTAPLPTGVRWIGKTTPSIETIAYDDRTNQLTWNVGNVVAGAGITSPKREIAFQVGVTPQPSQAGTAPILLNASTLAAHDEFTGKDITVSNLPIDTQLHWDTKMNSTQYSVQGSQ